MEKGGKGVGRARCEKMQNYGGERTDKVYINFHLRNGQKGKVVREAL